MSKGLEAFRIMVKDNDLELPYANTISTIEKELKRLEELEKAFDSLVKENETLGKMLSKEIEKNRALEIIKELFVFQPNKFNPFRWKELSVAPQEKIDLLKEVLL